LVENLLGKLMFGKVSSRWVKNVTVDFSMELTHDTILWHIYILVILTFAFFWQEVIYLFIYLLFIYVFSFLNTMIICVFFFQGQEETGLGF
jgi:hypothetical protein